MPLYFWGNLENFLLTLKFLILGLPYLSNFISDHCAVFQLIFLLYSIAKIIINLCSK